jgi:cation transport regulator ChaB
MPNDDVDLPGTLKRSPQKARDTYAQTLASAEKTYGGDEAAAHRVAWSAVKHEFEKTGDHWEPKDEPGPSDSRSEGSTGEKLAGKGRTHRGVDVNGHTRDELRERAERAGVEATSHMTKDELADAIARRNG